MRWLFVFVAVSLWGDIEDHLKRTDNKAGGFGLKNVDFIYMINLDRRPEKWKRSIEQLAPYGIHPYRFSAVNGWELTLEQLNDVGVTFTPEMNGGFMGTSYPLDGHFEPSHEILQRYGQNYFCHCMARGAIGIALSHISILQDAFESGYETIWVMEDDIEVVQDPNLLDDLIERLDGAVGAGQWDVLFTDKDMHDAKGNYTTTIYAGRRPDYVSHNDFAMKRPIDGDFIKIGARSGATSMIIRKSGIKKLLQYFKAHQIFLPYDMEFILPRGINLYTVARDIVTNLALAPSDNGGPNYLKESP